MKKLFFASLLLTLVFSCKKEPEIDVELNELFYLMQGSFNSELQSKKDSTYYNISLHMYPIWKEKGNYLYVEQALNSMQEKPYRQRIYKVTRKNENTFSSAIYTITNDSLWIGKWKSSKDFDSLKLEDITERKGCEVLLKRLDKNHFKGETGINTCKSSLRGASYATSEVEIKGNKIISWDRGFNAENTQVWGATETGYIFEKLMK